MDWREKQKLRRIRRAARREALKAMTAYLTALEMQQALMSEPMGSVH